MGMNPRTRRRRSNDRRPWPAARPSHPAEPGPARRRRPGPPEGRRAAPPRPGPSPDAILDRFTEGWDRGEGPRAEEYLGLLAFEDQAELIYREFCLVEAAGPAPDPADYLRRFPRHAEALGRLFSLHGAVSASSLRRWVAPSGPELPGSGDEIGPYRLIRELGRGAFARVFLAEQSDLGDRPVVVKVTGRATAEPTLLARARHAHIVEVLRQADAESESGPLHLICMPFLGGATLGAVLDARRGLGRRARSGRDLLADLDRVAAPEYPASDLPRPAREILAGLSHARALAWVVARLAEALDHAQARGVTHGDLKPSNILLTAEGMPMLFDFNLAVDRHEAADGGGPVDSGGTLAYMAPERLRAIAGQVDGSGRGPRPPDPHRADLYAMGLVLLEALTGCPPEIPRRRPGDARGLASAMADHRRGLPGPLRGRRAGPIPPALRSILARCLAPDPADRYTRGSELARDLDLWRADRPLAFAAEPRRSGFWRRARANRVALAGSAATLGVAAVVAALGLLAVDETGRGKALNKQSSIVDRADSGAFVFRKLGQWRVDELGDPAEVARRHLDLYGVATDPDWRSRDDFRSLPGPDREEMEAWLLEQVLRRAVALGERPDSPEDWARAEALLGLAVAKAPSAPLIDLRQALRRRLQLPPAGPDPADAPRPPAWLTAYLAGVAAEPLHAREALGLYREALRGRPGLFWAHYRSAVVACRIDEYPEAAGHLRHCVDRRPKNPALRAQLAAVLFRVERDTPLGKDSPWPPGSALAECEKALDLDPDFAEAIFTRALIRRASGQPESLESDIGRFALLTRTLGEAPALSLRVRSQFHYGANYEAYPELVRSLARRILAENPRDRETRMVLAAGLVHERRDQESLKEVEKVLQGDPDHLRARYLRAAQLRRLGSPAAIAEFASLIDHPRFEEVYREQPTAFRAFHYVATDLFERGRIAEALDVAERALADANRSRSLRNDTILARRNTSNALDLAPLGETYYLIARIHARAALDDPDRIASAADYLDRAFTCSPRFREWFEGDRRFDARRGEIVERLDARPVDR